MKIAYFRLLYRLINNECKIYNEYCCALPYNKKHSAAEVNEIYVEADAIMVNLEDIGT